MNKYLKFLLLTPILLIFVLIVLSNTFIGELLLSFLPYVVGVYFGFMFILTGVFFLIHIDLKRQNFYWFNWITIFFAFLLMFSFYFNMRAVAQESGDELKIISVNLWYKNDHHQEIQKFFNAEAADMILVSEFTTTQNQAIEQYLDQNYPYRISQLDSLSKPYTGKAIFSKYPIMKKDLNSPKFGELFEVVEVSHPSKNFDVALVHTTAPVNNSYYKSRNSQLEFLSETLPEFLGDSVILSGDFNTSPWSPKFLRMSMGLRDEGIEIIDYSGFNFSWSFQQAPFFKSHIDHTFLTDDITLKNYSLEDFPGSDHKAQVFTVAWE